MLQLTTILFLIAGSLLAVLHVIALQLFLYWRYWWLDLPMHALGGAVAALTLFTLYDIGVLKRKNMLRLIPTLGVVMLVAVSWELYEYFIGFTIKDDFVMDTTLDLLMGFLGGYIGHFVASRIRKLSV